MRIVQALTTFSLIAPMIACSGEPGDDPSNITDGFSAPQCASPDELCLGTPEDGFQIRSEGTSIQAGEDVEYCEVVVLPGSPSDEYYVHAFETQMTQGSHHLIVAAVEPGTDTDAEAVPGDRRPCTGPDVYGGELLPVTGAQIPYASETFPDGVGRVYRGGQKIIFDYHYFNTSTQPIKAKAAVNFHTTTPEKVLRLSQSFGFINLGINIPPGATASFTQECTFRQDIMVHKLTRHTHQWGTDFSVWHAGGERDGELVFHSPDYETVDFPMAEPVFVPAGEGYRFECNFTNTESYTLKFGLKASDEMCILFGSWYPANDAEAPTEQSCVVF